MKLLGLATILGLAVAGVGAAWGQQAATSAKVESMPLELTPPDRFQIASVLGPLRQVKIMATADGVLRTMEAQVGAAVREGQVIAQLDKSEATVRLKIAQAQVKEMKAAANSAVGQAQLEAAQARAELAQLELDRCTLRAPFPGRLLDTTVFEGQYVTKGTTIATLADVSSLRASVPLDRATATVGATVTISVEGQPVEGKVKAALPLDDSLGRLRELATLYTSAWVVIPNTKGEFEPGQRAFSHALPSAPIATVPTRAVQPAADKKHASIVQLIRNEYVTNVHVQILGRVGSERTQVSGPFRPTDALIVSTSVPLAAGTLIRFSGAVSTRGVEGTSPNPAQSGAVADIAPPRTAAQPKVRTPAATQPAAKPAPKPAGVAVPF